MILADGVRLLVHDEELEADGEARYSEAEHLWVAAIDWRQVRPWTDDPDSAETHEAAMPSRRSQPSAADGPT